MLTLPFAGLPLGGIPIRTHASLERQLKPYTRRPLKRYKQRTLKRWARNPKHWTEPQMYIVAGREIVCAPSLLPVIRQLLTKAAAPSAGS